MYPDERLTGDRLAAGGAVAESAADNPRVAEALQEYLAGLEAGRPPQREEFLARHASVAEALVLFLEGLELMHAAAAPASAGAADEPEGGTPLGDFRLVREVGRGGMGVVYEAEQLSLGRRVALKVLPFAATMDARQLQRFKNEARAAASLHHEDIVPVYAVGCDRGVHYYAMQFIDGQTLAAFLRDRRRGVLADQPTTPERSAPVAETAVAAATSTPLATDAAYLRRVAAWGIAAAEALEHAHSLGIVHRDVKPGNLMLDGQGKLWVTDFGLARLGTSSDLTLTGDVVGTLRYMSPEQALAKHGLVDHRTDVYSLGATLYELVTGVPAVGGDDRQEILRRITFEEVRPPRAVNRAVPRDLETVLLKALAREPAARYPTARELSDDLRRFLDHRSVLAKRPGWMEHGSKWAWRHRWAVTGVAALLVLAVVCLAVTLGVVAAALEDKKAALSDAEGKLNEAQIQRAQAEEQRRQTKAKLDQAIRVLGPLFRSAQQAIEGGRLHEARPAIAQLRTVCQLVVDNPPDDPKARWELLDQMNGLAKAVEGLGANAQEDAVGVWKAHNALWERSVEEFPDQKYIKEINHFDLATGYWAAEQLGVKVSMAPPDK